MAARSPAAYENQLRLSREAKRRRRGTCADCGAQTRYSGRAGAGVSQRCLRCAARKRAETQRGTGSVNSKILAALARGPMTYSEIQDILDVPPNQMGGALIRLLRYGLIERPRRGVYQLPE